MLEITFDKIIRNLNYKINKNFELLFKCKIKQKKWMLKF